MLVGAVLDDDKAYMTAIRAERLLYGQFVNIKTEGYRLHTVLLYYSLIILLIDSVDQLSMEDSSLHSILDVRDL
jgi:hypothetical protein